MNCCKILKLLLLSAIILMSCSKKQPDLKATRDFLDKGEYQKAYKTLKKYNEKEYSLTEVYYLLKGVALFELDSFESAKVAFDSAISKDASQGKAYFNRGLTLLQLKDYVNAIKDFKAAESTYGASEDLWLNRGIAYYHTKQYDDALENFNKILVVEPTHKPALYNRGNVYFAKEKHGEAVEDFKKIIALDEKYAKAHYALGLTLIDSGAVYQGCKSLIQAKELNYSEAEKMMNTYCKSDTTNSNS